MDIIKEQIQEMINCETGAWNEKDAETLVLIFHPDMVWPRSYGRSYGVKSCNVTFPLSPQFI